MIVTDLDGTLLREDKTVSQRTRDALARCRAAGIKIAFATGRPGSVESMIPLEFFDGRVINNGAIIYAGDQLIDQRLIPWQTLRPYLLECIAIGLSPVTQLGVVNYTTGRIHANLEPTAVFEVVDFAEHQKDTEKVTIDIRNPQDIVFMREHLPQGLRFGVTRYGDFDIMLAEATKAGAIAFLAQYWGIRQEEIVAFGDDINDIDLLAFAGVGVAMANAIETTRAAADEVCDSNEDDGVAKWLEEHILMEQGIPG